MEAKSKRTPDSRSGEKGAVSIKTVLVFTFLIVAVITLIKVVPVYIQQQEIVHDADELARKASLGLNAYSKPKIEEEIQKMVRENGLPEGSVSLVSMEENRAEIVVKYTTPIDFYVTTYNWDVNQTVVHTGL